MQLQTESAPIVSCFYFLRIKTNPSCMNSFSANFCSTYQQACIPKFITICADSTKTKHPANQVLQRLFD